MARHRAFRGNPGVLPGGWGPASLACADIGGTRVASCPLPQLRVTDHSRASARARHGGVPADRRRGPGRGKFPGVPVRLKRSCSRRRGSGRATRGPRVGQFQRAFFPCCSGVRKSHPCAWDQRWEAWEARRGKDGGEELANAIQGRMRDTAHRAENKCVPAWCPRRPLCRLPEDPHAGLSATPASAGESGEAAEIPEAARKILRPD